MTGTGSGKGPDAGPGTGSASAATFTALTGFTGGALPYAGGNPYADYRAAAAARADLTGLVDLADRRLGAGVAAANDEFFAERENLLLRAPAVFDPERFGHKGKVMDGWETRRRRGPSADLPHPLPGDHDWALIRLGAPGVVRAVVVDTAHFRDRKSTRLNSSHMSISYAVFCLKKKKKNIRDNTQTNTTRN